LFTIERDSQKLTHKKFKKCLSTTKMSESNREQSLTAIEYYTT